MELDLSREGNGSLREHLRVSERNSRRQTRRLHLRPPPGTEHVWGWFKELVRGRSADGLSYAEIAAWADLTRSAPTPMEVEAVKLLDAIRLDVLRRENGR